MQSLLQTLPSSGLTSLPVNLALGAFAAERPKAMYYLHVKIMAIKNPVLQREAIQMVGAVDQGIQAAVAAEPSAVAAPAAWR